MRRSPYFPNPTILGVVRPPSELEITMGCPPSKTATQLFVVPKSMPMTFPITPLIQLSVISYQLSVNSCQLIVVSHQL